MLLLSTASLTGYGLHKVFLLAKEAGYDGLDLSIDFDQFDTIDATYIDGLIQETGVNVHSLTAPERRLTKKHFDQILSIASEL